MYQAWRHAFARQQQVLRSRLIAGMVVPVLVTLSDGIATGQGRFDDLLSRIPASANTVVVVDVKAAYNSPLAVRKGWKDYHQAAYVKQPLFLPPESDRLVLASQINPNRDFAQVWEGAMVSLTQPISMGAVAKAEGGYVDSIRKLQAAWTPSDAYFVSFEPKMMGVMYPADRQAVSRWVDYGRQNRTVNISPYLKQASSMVDGTTQIVVAMELKDAVRPHILQEGLGESELTRDDPAKQREWAAIISSIQGVTLSVQLSESARGTLQVDFAESTTPFGGQAKALVLTVLEKYGAGIDEMEKWKATVQSHAIVLEGNLSTSAMRRLFSLVELPTSKFSTLKDETPAGSNDSESIAKASQTYFSSVTTLLDDLRDEFKTNRDVRRGLASVYLERYGRKIDRLPILNVDEELLAYGASVSETLRSVSVTSRMSGVRTGVRKSQIYGNYLYQDNGYGYYGVRKSSSVRSQIKHEEQAKANEARFESWKEIEDATAAIRSKMSQKYMVQF